MIPTVKCPNCSEEQPINDVLTAQSNQDVIYNCPNCNYELKNIHTSKG
jgi:uncharacterized Zn finger protein